MKNTNRKQDDAVLLRQKAEELFKQKQSVNSTRLSEIDTLKLLYELEVHQIELKMQNEELQQAKEIAEILAEKYTNLYDFAPAGYFTLDNDCRILELNLGGAAMLGKERSKMINSNFNLFVTSQTRTVFNDFFLKVKETGIKQTCELRLCQNETPTIFVHLEGVFSETEQKLLLTVSDISERKKAETELITAKEKAEQNEEKLSIQKIEIELNNDRLESLLRISQFQTNSIQKLLDFALDEAINLTNSKIGYIYFYNENTKQFILNTWSKDVIEECAVMNPQTVYDLDKTGCWGEAVRQRKPIIINEYIAENKIKKGTPQGHVKLSKFLTIPVIFDNQIVAVAGVANKTTDYNNSDIRQLTLLMDTVWKISERLNLIDNLKAAKEKAEESDRLKTAFLQNMSHEIRTPLNAISGFSGMLNKPELSDEKRKSFVTIIRNSSQQLISIVSDILTISSLQTKQEKLNIDKVCINSIIINLLAIFKQQATNKNISLYAKQQLSDKQSEIYTDNTKITQIITNLLSNALKFTHEGFIEFGYNFKNNELEFYVKDSGIGIKPEFHDKIFERFRQADQSINKLYGGTGLGLAISKAFTELLGGKIWVQSELEKGSTFYFTIPYNPVNTNEINKSANQQIKASASATILVAEDDEYNFLFIKELLIDMDFKLIHTKDGKETVDICKTNPKIDLILMDIKMPIMDGQVAAKLIKEFRPNLPIIAQSAYGLEQEKEKYSGAEFDDYITKPIKEEELKQKVMKYISKQENIHLRND